MMMYGDWGNGWMGMGFGGGLVMLLFWGLAIVGLVALVRWGFSKTNHTGVMHETRALEILQRRYASGEVDQQTYERMKSELDSRS